MILLITGFVISLSASSFSGPPLPMQKAVKQPANQSPEIQRQKVETQKIPEIDRQKPSKIIYLTKLTAENMIGAVGDSIPLKASLFKVHQGKEDPLSRQRLSFYVSGKLAGIGTTNINGKAEINYKVPDETGAKEIMVKFNGSEKYQPSSDTANLSMLKSSTKMDLELSNPNTPKYPGSNVFLKGRLYRITDNAGINGREIILEAQGKYIDKVASTGFFSCTYSIPEALTGNLKFTARFEGDSLYLGSVRDLHVNVLPPKQDVYLFWNSVSGQVGQTVTVNVKTSKSKNSLGNKGVSGIHIGVSRGGKRIAEGYTDANGQFNAQIKLEHMAGKYNLNVYRIGTGGTYNVYPTDHGKRFLTITKSPVNIWINGSTTARSGDKLMFTVTVNRTSDDTGIGDLQVNFAGEVKNTSHMGSAVFYYTVPSTAGRRILIASTRNNTRYLGGKGSFTLNVLPKNN